MAIYRLKLLGLLTFVIRLNAQTTNVTRCIPEYQWTINHRNQTPCLVAAFLESACSGTPHQVNQIPPETHYIGPTASEADLCSCNSVTYSLVEACGECQNRSQIISFAQWTNNCPQVVQVGQFPVAFPLEVDVPSWAKLNISGTNNFFDPISAAQEAARSSVSSIIMSLSTTSSSPGTPVTPIQTPPVETSEAPRLPASSVPSTDSGGISAGGIAGITVGVLMAVMAVLLFIFWRMLRARRQRNTTQAPNPSELVDPFNDIQNQSPFPVGHVQSRSPSDPMSIVTPYIYNPVDVSHGSDSIGASALYTTGPVRNSADDLVSPQTALSPRTIVTVQRSNTPQTMGSRGYTGAPEV